MSEPAVTFESLAPGFDDPVADSQAVFRRLLEAMAHPGRIVALDAVRLPRPVGLSSAAAALALSLADFETPLWLDPGCAAAAGWLRFHAGAPVVADPAAARFAFLAGIAALPPLERFDLGSEEYPDRSATLIVEVAGLHAGDALRLSGPGIATVAELCVDGIAPAFWAARAALAPLFPRGLDLVLTAGERLAALPRTTRVEV